jgi:hypothetical protein
MEGSLEGSLSCCWDDVERDREEAEEEAILSSADELEDGSREGGAASSEAVGFILVPGEAEEVTCDVEGLVAVALAELGADFFEPFLLFDAAAASTFSKGFDPFEPSAVSMAALSCARRREAGLRGGAGAAKRGRAVPIFCRLFG